MKRLLLFLISLLFVSVAFSQTQNLRPPWVVDENDLPQLGSARYYGKYDVVKGTGRTVISASEQAIRKHLSFRNLSSSVRSSVKMDASGQLQLKMAGDDQRIKQEIVAHYEETEPNGDVTVWLLLWIPNPDAEDVRPPAFRVSYETTGQREISNGGALLRSFLLPGWGSMYKGHYTKGALYMVGTLGALTGSILCDIKRKNMQELEAELGNLGLFWTSKGWRRMSIIGYSITGVLYTIQLIDAYNSSAPEPRVRATYLYSEKSSLHLEPWLALQEAGQPAVFGAQLRISF